MASSSPPRLRRPLPAVLAVALVLVALDQLSKWWALGRLDTETVDLFWTLRLRLAFNSGSAFSIGAGSGRLIALVALGIVIVLLWLGRTAQSRLAVLALGLVLGGALGNLTDRAVRAGDGFMGGRVVDFIDFQWWPVFNVADMGIVIGGLLLVLAGGWRGDEVDPHVAEPHVEGDQPTADASLGLDGEDTTRTPTEI